MFRQQKSIMDAMVKMEESLQVALEQLSIIYPEFDLTDPHNKNTSHRIAKAWMEMCKGLGMPQFEFTTFPNEDGLEDNWVILKDIEFSSLCQHHFMPFSGVVHVGYVPGDEICGISKIARVVDYFSQRPQVQERLGHDILGFIQDRLRPVKIAVIIESKHTCVGCRGIKSRNSTMVTTHAYDSKVLKEFREMIK